MEQQNINDAENRQKEEFEYGAKTKAIRIIDALQLIICIFSGIIHISDNTFIGIMYIVISIVVFFLIKGFSDMIDLLDSINYKMK